MINATPTSHCLQLPVPPVMQLASANLLLLLFVVLSQCCITGIFQEYSHCLVPAAEGHDLLLLLFLSHLPVPSPPLLQYLICCLIIFGQCLLFSNQSSVQSGPTRCISAAGDVVV